MIFRVTLERHTRESASVEIEAESIDEAKDLAVDYARRGDVVWEDENHAIEIVQTVRK